METVLKKYLHHFKVSLKTLVLKSILVISFFLLSDPVSSSPYLYNSSAQIPPSLRYTDAAGRNDFCGTPEVILDALGDFLFIAGHTFTYEWEVYEHQIFPNGWMSYGSNINRRVTVNIPMVPFRIELRCKVKEWVSGVLWDEWVTGIADIYFAAAAPSIFNNPLDLAICEGSPASFTVSSSGNYLTYQWYEASPGGTAQKITGATSNKYTFNPNPPVSKTGYRYKCIVSNGCGSPASNDAILSVNTPPVFNSISGDISVCEGVPVFPSFTAYFSNNVNLITFYKSTDNGIIWSPVSSVNPGTSGNYTYTLPSSGYLLNGSLYKATVSNNCPPEATSQIRKVGIKKPPSISVHPQNITACIGSPAILSVTAAGEGIEYKWRKAGATYQDWNSSDELTISSISSGDATQWDVLIRNECATAGIESEDATITVNPKPNIELGSDKKICQGSSVTLNAGAGFKTYLWSNGATSRYTTVNTQGAYTATVTDNNDCSASDIVSVFVDSPLPPVNLGKDIVKCSGELVVLDATDNYDTYLWSTGSTGQSVIVNQSGKYSVTAGWNSSVCKASDTINVNFCVPYENEEICMVMIDPDTEKNMIIWEKTPNVGTAQYQVLKISGASYTAVATTAKSDSSYVIDWSSKPQSKTDAYVLVVIDSCGNASQKSPWHKPFFLQSSIGLNDVVNLNWEPYLIDGKEYIFKSIVIFRGTDSTKLVPIDTISAGIGSVSYTDTNPPKNVKVYYRIGGEKDVPCDPNHILGRKVSRGPYVHSLSNLEDNRLMATGLKQKYPEEMIEIYPNPMKTVSKITWGNPAGDLYELLIYDLNGKLLRSVSGLNSQEYFLQREKLSSGCYIIELRGRNLIHERLLVD